jgi:hypothetical protein
MLIWFFLSIPISNKSAQIWAGPVSKISKKLTYCIFIAVHILLGWFWLEFFRTAHTITCWEERLNFENTLYVITYTECFLFFSNIDVIVYYAKRIQFFAPNHVQKAKRIVIGIHILKIKLSTSKWDVLSDSCKFTDDFIPYSPSVSLIHWYWLFREK